MQKNKIGKLLFKKVFIWYIVVAFILTAFQVYSEYLTQKKSLNSMLETTGEIFTETLSYSLWNLDEIKIQANVETILALNNVEGISIIDQENRVVTESGNTLVTQESISHSFQLVKEEEILANVTLYSNKSVIYNSMKNNVYIILFNSLIKSLVLMLLVYYFSNRMITQTLRQLIEALNKINFSNNERIDSNEIDINDDSDISLLVKSYNDMKDRIYDELDKNKRLSERVELALLGTNDGIWDWNILDNTIYFAPRWKEMLGYRDEELPNEIAAWESCIHPDDLDDAWRDVYKNINGETEFYENIQRLRHKDGHWVWISARGKVQYDEDGKAVRMIGTHTDISKDKEIEKKLTFQAQIIEQTHDSVITTDFDGFITSWNGGAQRLLEYSAKEAIGRHITILHAKEDLSEVSKSIEILRESGGYSTETSHITKSGKVIYVQLSLSLLKDENGTSIGFVGFAQNITKRREIQNEFEEKRKILEESQRLAHIGSWKLDLVADKLTWSDEIYRIFDIEFSQEPSYDFFMKCIHPDDRDEVNNAYINSLQDRSPYAVTHRLLLESGRIKYVKEECATSFDVDGKPLISIGTVQDITEQKLLELELHEQKDVLNHLAYHDSLTKLPNRTYFNEKLSLQIQTAKRENSQFALLFLDLDHFKEINDSMGHDIGDEVLKIVTTRLRDVMREVDVLSRLGGDEFTVIMKNLKQGQDASVLAQKILHTLSDPIVLGGNSLYISSSIGISLYPSDGSSSSNLLKYADAAMYRAKDEGRNNFQFYSSEMTELAFERVVMEASLRTGIQNGEFVVYYQPQVDAGSARLTGMEALVRWKHPTMGLVSPAKFIPLAESTGLIIELDQFVMRTAMDQFGKWYKEGLNPGVLALNLSVKQLQQKGFTSVLKSLLNEAQYESKLIELEVTESQVMSNPEEAIKILNEISGLGVKLAIDDFGTGYSSLSYLKKLPINKVKIDQSFIMDLPEDEEDAAITKAVIALASSLNLGVIAEGVETEKQKEFLLDNGCHNIQGYYYSRPLPVDEVETVLQNGFTKS